LLFLSSRADTIYDLVSRTNEYERYKRVPRTC